MEPVGFINSLSLGLFHQWKPERLFMIFTIFGDESGTHKSGTTIIAGYVSHARGWRKFEKDWKKSILEKFEIDAFHAKEVKGWREGKKQKSSARCARQ